MSKARRTRTQTVRAPADVELVGTGELGPHLVEGLGENSCRLERMRGLVVHVDGPRGVATVWRDGERIATVRERTPRLLLVEIGRILATLVVADELESVGLLPPATRGRA